MGKVFVILLVIALLAVSLDAQKAKKKTAKKGRRRGNWAPKIYQFKDTAMDNSTCLQRCAKPDMSKKSSVYCCTAFYNGATDNQCFLILRTGKKFKKPADLTLQTDSLYKSPPRRNQKGKQRKGGKRQRKGGKRQRKGGKRGRKPKGPKVYILDDTNGMDNKTCGQRCAKPDLTRGKKTGICVCSAFYTGPTENKCYILVWGNPKAFKKPSDLALSAGGFYRTTRSKNSRRRKGGKNNKNRRQRKRKQNKKQQASP